MHSSYIKFACCFVAIVAVVAQSSSPLPETQATVFIVKDILSDNYKQISYVRTWKQGWLNMTITPYGNDQTWSVNVIMKDGPAGLQGDIDFNVPGYPNPPRVNPNNPTVLVLWNTVPFNNRSTHKGQHILVFSYYDTMTPENSWIEVDSQPI